MSVTYLTPTTVTLTDKKGNVLFEGKCEFIAVTDQTFSMTSEYGIRKEITFKGVLVNPPVKKKSKKKVKKKK